MRFADIELQNTMELRTSLPEIAAPKPEDLDAKAEKSVALAALGWLWWRLWSPLGPCDAAPLLRGRRGTWRYLPSLCVAGVALTALGWRLWSPLGPCDAAPLLRGRRGTWRQLPSFCVAGVALGDICLRFVCQAWHLRHWAGSGDGLGRRWGPVTPPLFCVAGVALGDICLRFVWQAWHLRHWAGSGDGLGRRWGPVTPPLFCVAGAWHLVTSAFVLCGRRGTCGTGLALVTALVAAGAL
eukprot:s1575_g20.t1